MPAPTNRELLTSGNTAYQLKRAKKKKNEPQEEVTFDRGARKEFLTGFHKRKLQRKEHAVQKAKEIERKEKQEEKRKIKEERLKDAQKDLERYNEQIKELVARENSDVEDQDEDEEEEQEEQENSDYSDWEGLDNENTPSNGILKKRKEKYEDDDGSTTTVTIEALDTDNLVDNKVLADNAVDLSMSDKVLKSSLEKAELSAKHLAMMNSKRSIRKQQIKIKKSRTRTKGVSKKKKNNNSRKR